MVIKVKTSIMTQSEICLIIQDAAFEVRRNFLPGYLESVYKKALLHELRLRGLKASEEVCIPVKYKGVSVGDFRADIVVENSIILEIKAVKQLVDIHSLQLINYLHVTGFEVGYLINYGGDIFKCQQKTRLYNKR